MGANLCRDGQKWRCEVSRKSEGEREIDKKREESSKSLILLSTYDGRGLSKRCVVNNKDLHFFPFFFFFYITGAGIFFFFFWFPVQERGSLS